MNINHRILFVVKGATDEFIGIMTISSLLKENGFRVELVEAEYAKVMKKLKEALPTILAYSTPSEYVYYYLGLNKRIKEDFKIFSVFGGPHPTSVPEMVGEEGVDGVCIGEGEFPMLELAQNLSSGRPVRDIGNWWIKENGTIFKNPLRPLVENLDTLPFPDRELFRDSPLRNKAKMSIISGRGCVYNCGYCYNYYYRQLFSPGPAKIRKRSVKNVIQEIGQFRNRPSLQFISFDDSLFILPSEWLEEFSLLYKKHINLPFMCNVRADIVNETVIKLLRNAGCFSVSLGIETADDHLRKGILCRTMAKEQIVDAIKVIKNHKIRLRTTNIIGIPHGSIEKDIQTIRLNIDSNVDYAKGIVLQPFPKTLLWENGFRCDKYEYSRFDSYNYLRKFYSERELENLNHLFSFIVMFPSLFCFIRILIRLPLKYLYRFLYIVCEAYCVSFKVSPSNPNGFFLLIRKYVRTVQDKFIRKIKK